MKQSDDVVGLLSQRGRFLVAEPFFDRGGRMTVERDRRAKPGHLALVRRRGRSAKVVKLLGRPDVARDVIEALMVSRGLWRSFPPGVERAADEARSAVPASAAAERRADLRDLPTFTIDPVDARDFDDAISCERLGDDGWRVWVHIADVSAFVRPGTQLDREAYRRSTSVYVPGAVEPMLPQPLSNDACSLVHGADRLAVTVEFELHGTDIARVAFHRSLIRSDKRLDYDQVDRIFAGSEQAEAPWAEPLAAAREAATALARRAGADALVLDSAEPEFRFDGRGHVTDATERAQTESHRLIERLMIAANEQVAKFLSERSTATLFRVHERPEPASVERLVAQLASLDVPTPPLPERLSASQAAEAIGEISHIVDQHVRRTGHGRRALTSLILRALRQAHYSPRNRGHAGLGLTHYCHFTSPIRRYPDLLCHRALLSAVGAGEQPPPSSALDEAGTWTSDRERDAMAIERDADDIASCFLLERTLFEQGTGTVFDGEVVGVIGAGAFVAFGGGYEGMLPVRRLQGDWWELNEEGTLLRGEQSGDTIRLGDRVRVRVERVDAPRGRVDLVPE
ncbi:MAG TPA: RNB domain-containing ribonuclease [Solirubrobacteraceae bacterium]|nr:RNB domain-containing ribonuclease [Solirubrobacteraceae bacterium]